MAKLSLLPVVIDIDVVQETDNPIEFTLTDGDGNPVNLTNDTVKFTARASHGGTIKIATKTNGPGQHSSPLTGKTRFSLTKTDLTTGQQAIRVEWVYEARRILAVSGQEVTYITGTLGLDPVVAPA